ncbi:ketosteroid isomerase-like protein [Thermosporothrix hazakensis]|uniref:Ketosteroid isomerase-like protein n=2 Tax=Thermosporothrix TaxID=768650 RepID=A0A326UBZ6_THEHA|nr:hypothetical protein [Thermosporothrix hazakensis]PZW25715.1 ketosteroid isomerase-like protein [Thermosporothrix hazakensis]BBH90009.1 hypothetical protein KTC_47600 [Thermosporothrix sp. COM3]GCE48210.1 hypothetical protein KTH_30790 [Thermosporothrix hazakensis]
MSDPFIVTSPEQMNSTFARAFNSGKIENLLSLYEANACLVSPEGVPHVGLAAIRDDLCRLLQLPGRMVSINRYAFVTEDIALLQAEFQILENETILVRGVTAEIVRRQPDGRWLYVIDHPAGGLLAFP